MIRFKINTATAWRSQRSNFIKYSNLCIHAWPAHLVDSTRSGCKRFACVCVLIVQTYIFQWIQSKLKNVYVVNLAPSLRYYDFEEFECYYEPEMVCTTVVDGARASTALLICIIFLMTVYESTIQQSTPGNLHTSTRIRHMLCGANKHPLTHRHTHTLTHETMANIARTAILCVIEPRQCEHDARELLVFMHSINFRLMGRFNYINDWY